MTKPKGQNMNIDKDKKLFIAKIKAIRKLVEDWEEKLPTVFLEIVKPILESDRELENQ